MMKRMMVIVLALVLMVSGAQAQSIFSTKGENTVNFGQALNVEPVDVKTNTFTGQKTEIYENVTWAMFSRFGEILGVENYLVINSEERADGLYYEVGQDGVASMIILYDQQSGHLEISMASASAGKPAPQEKTLPAVFNGCKQINYGETVKLSGYGRFTIEKLVLGKKTDYLYSDMFIGTRTYPGSLKAEAYLVGSFENTGTQTKKVNQLMNCTLYYITDENTYTYKDWVIGLHQSQGVYIGSYKRSGGVNFDVDNSWPFTSYNQPTVGSLESCKFAAVLTGVPQVVQTSKDGMLAVVIQCNGEKFVIVDRWE